ncbi:TPA: fibronectin-binding protein FnbB [Staphylococcus aureus]|nr:fibronectin-binding protein FnbB [Staphylococcus aureus]HCY9563136.1 fibronectin-binding protein FnbB [Staphylococcus aureus]HDC5310929.1 fibronectin-binding protein FnbB [Staphylococcus aureus]HDC5973785.1 fibronectin-binding protein FnbB [Staphylococcus aureus]HDC9182850.1 fibronectin-binding protein FnbB [Staphylococcus aureus]
MKSNLRYGIRKHKLGAASVFLGTMIVVGMGQEKEAAASEQNNTTVEESGSSATESKASETQTTTNNVNTIDETQSYSATSTEQPSQSTQVTTEEAPTTVQAPKVETEMKSQEDLASEKAYDKETTGTQVDAAQPSNVLEIKPRMKRSTDVAAVAEKEVVEEAKATGTDVTNKVKITESSLEGHKQGTNVVNPHNAERVTLKYKWNFDEGIKAGDYFDFTLSNNVETHGISPLRKVPDIKSKDDNIVAVGRVLDERKIRYIFKEYVKDKKDLTAELSLNLFIDPTTVTKQGKQTIEVKLGENKISKEFDIKYLDGVKDKWGVTVNGRITLLDKQNNKIHHLAYINPKKSEMTSITINGFFAKGGLFTESTPTVKVYEYLGSDELPESVYANTNDQEKFKDVTNDMSDKLTLSENGSYKLTLDALNKKSYVVSFEGKYNENDKELLFRTNLHGYHDNYGYYYYYPVSLTWDNGVAFYSNNAKGDGKDKPNDPIIEKSEPIDLDIKSEPPVEKHELTGTIEESNDSKPIDFEYHTAVEGVEGHAEGTIETEEDSIHVDFEESTHENSKHHADVVEYEEDTNPGGGQVTTESNLVEFDEESTKGIVTGAVSDHTTVEDTKEYTTESNLIELVDELPEEHGQAQGPIEEITENNHHISHSGLGTENGHGNYGVIEEIEENSHVDIKSELGYEGGQNSGNQSFEEDTEEDKPKYEQGGNIVDIDFDSVPQIQGQNNGNQSFEEDTEKDKPKYEQGGNIIDIDFDSVPQIHGFNKHNEIIEEDTNKDKPNYQFGGHNSVDFEEDTLPKVSGQNEGQQTIEEDTMQPTPPTPEVPSEPETPTPPTPEVPSEPGTPVPPTPEVPAEPGKPVPPAKEEPKKPSKPVEQGKVVTPVIEINEKVKAVAPTKQKQSKKSELPETGGEESTNKGMLFGGLFSILGLALLRRNKKNNKA